MGIGTLLTGALKGVSWLKIAEVVMEYGPELYRQACERFQKSDQPPHPQQAEIELQERIDRLEKLVVEQDIVLRKHVARNEQLEEVCLQLEGRLKTWKLICVVLAGVCLMLAVMLFR